MEEEWDDDAIDFTTGAYNLDPDALMEKTPDEKMLEQMADAEYFKRKGELEEVPQEKKKKGLFHRRDKKK